MINTIDKFNFDFEKIEKSINLDSPNKIDISNFFANTDFGSLQINEQILEFNFCLQRNRFDNNKKSLIIISSKDNSKILNYCLENLHRSSIIQYADVLLVDDRSIDDQIISLSDKYQTSYLRIDNTKNIFNYSVINNIAAIYGKLYNKEILIFHNSDLWQPTNNTLEEILKKHILYSSGITGCKLAYPTKDQYKDIGKPQHILNNYLDKIYETIQHGGIHFFPKTATYSDKNRQYLSTNICLFPTHLWRFSPLETPLASVDSFCSAVTGALQIINTELFFKVGCYNTSLSASFQDIDICVKFLQNNIPIYYVGQEFMFHAESVTTFKENIQHTNYAISDTITWQYLWGVRLPRILGYIQ